MPDPLQLSITSLAPGGDGVSRLPDGRTVFLPCSAPGDLVEATIIKEHHSYARATVVKVLTPGPDRVEPPCPAFVAGCGGCAWQHLRYEAQATAKDSFLREALRRIGGVEEPPLRPFLSAAGPYAWRNKAQVPCAPGPKGEPLLGYYREGTHEVVPLPAEGCRLLEGPVDQALRFVRENLPALGLKAATQGDTEGGLRHVMVRANSRGEAMVVLVTQSPLDGKAVKAASAWAHQACIVSVQNNVQPRGGNVILGAVTRVLRGPDALEEELDGLRFRLSPTSFFQVNPSQTLALLRVLLGLRTWAAGEQVLELYCGIGTLSLPLARAGLKLFGVESHAAAVEDARANAKANGLEAAFAVADAAQAFNALPPGFVPSVVVVDPPRKGLDLAVVEAVHASSAGALAYVSCDPASLARDAKRLLERGWRLESCQGVDLFPQTPHLESVSLFLRGA